MKGAHCLIMKKAKGVFVNLIGKTIKAIPAIILAAVIFGMAAYVICVNVIPLGYCAKGEFSISENQWILLKENDAFYSRVAEEYSASEGNISTETAKRLFSLLTLDGEKYTVRVKATSPEVSYGLMNSVLTVADEFAGENGGSYFLIHADNIPTLLSRGDMLIYYVLAAAIIGAALVLISAMKKGLALSVVESEKEFTRVTNIRLLGTIPYSAHPLTRNKPSKAKSE